MIGSLGGGVGVGVLAESLNKSVTSPRALASLLEAPLLGVVPRVQDEAARARRRKWIVLGLIAAVLAGLIGLALIHFLHTPLDTLWYVLMRTLQLN
jgi:capsular polysaccharide biosynthesis protein